MYVLEHRVPCPTGRRRHRWQAAAICGKVDLLRKIRDAQLDADHWRIVMAPGAGMRRWHTARLADPNTVIKEWSVTNEP